MVQNHAKRLPATCALHVCLRTSPLQPMPYLLCVPYPNSSSPPALIPCLRPSSTSALPCPIPFPAPSSAPPLPPLQAKLYQESVRDQQELEDTTGVELVQGRSAG